MNEETVKQEILNKITFLRQKWQESINKHKRLSSELEKISEDKEASFKRMKGLRELVEKEIENYSLLFGDFYSS